MVSESRFDESLILLGLIPDQSDARSILQVLVRDPGGDITSGYRPAARRAELPLTYMASQAIAGRPGVHVDGYRDYRGVPVVGAWKWLPDADLGVATEIDYAEAFQPLTILRRRAAVTTQCRAKGSFRADDPRSRQQGCLVAHARESE